VKTGRWAGIVTAFITMSNVKDEIVGCSSTLNVSAERARIFRTGNFLETPLPKGRAITSGKGSLPNQTTVDSQRVSATLSPTTTIILWGIDSILSICLVAEFSVDRLEARPNELPR
jgi:hypothetical protein